MSRRISRSSRRASRARWRPSRSTTTSRSKAGQILVTLDPRDYETAVATAQAAVERDKAQYADASATFARQPPIIEEQEGNVAAARARLTFAERDARRFGNLALTGAGTVQQEQQADTSLQQSRAQLQSATASLDAAKNSST